MSVLAMLLTVILAAVGMVLTWGLLAAFYVGLFVLIIRGATTAPAALFAFLFAFGGNFENGIVKIIIFVVCFIVMKALMQYKKVRCAVAAQVAIIASIIGVGAVQSFVPTFFGVNVPEIVWIVATFIIAVVLFLPVVVLNDRDNNHGNQFLLRIVASILYGSALTAVIGVIVGPFISTVPSWLNPVLTIANTVIAFVLDTVFTMNGYDFTEKLSRNGLIRFIASTIERVAKK